MEPTAYDKLIEDVTEVTRLGRLTWTRLDDAALDDPAERDRREQLNAYRERHNRAFGADYERDGKIYTLHFVDKERPDRFKGSGERYDPELRVIKGGKLILTVGVYDVDDVQLQTLYAEIVAQKNTDGVLDAEAEVLLSTF